uniref:E2 ubiquitin-conjugating enzyme n=1 Tax=Rhizochromulina marina TaxID=1034831 RepID=A0A7S2WUS3_9STRA|eukprot:CAMPEP_0118966350 /NCGR_PEP_ID=MMETSP1173-20130426/3823_1 /TAXON_ID=1034831 /ORGANISM="Rhizochromulina marina cf, Strain CCMP1243" /LENGTH=150 /DNA_ID=CAMNT_0006915111 /DNA_START=31 /DNA_END=483 /DNA_ORIENTATION=-
MASNRRLTKELGDLGTEPVDGCDVGPADENMYNWKAMITGPAGTPYEEGLFEVDIVFPTEYPFKAPQVKFITSIYHPNIKTTTGEICADVIQNGWSPTLNVRYVLNSIKQMMEEPNAESPLEPTIAEQYSNDREAFDAAARAFTAEHAGI